MIFYGLNAELFALFQILDKRFKVKNGLFEQRNIFLFSKFSIFTFDIVRFWILILFK